MISGLHDPRWLYNILDNYNRQKYLYKRLIIVENGNGINVTKDQQLPIGTIVLTSKRGPTQAINVGISFLKAKNKLKDWFCKCDADDYYGPEYIAQINKASKSGADYIGRDSLYIKTMDGRLWYAEGKSEYIFHGPTLAAKIGGVLDFPLVTDWGEDYEWCKAMHNSGKKALAIKPEGFCYQRWGDYKHTWPCTDFEIRTSWLVDFFDIGTLDFDIVNGIKIRPSGIILERPVVDYTNFMPFRILKEKGIGFVGIGI